MNHKEKKMCGVISSIIIIEMACFVGKRVSVECDVIYFRMYLTDMQICRAKAVFLTYFLECCHCTKIYVNFAIAGIFSDTHLLAMIYAGEMCYWYSCAQERGLFRQDDQHDSFTARHRGLKHLNSYLCAVKGPLKTLNWNAEKAEHYVSYLSRGLQQ